jgi:hypothetical protein
VNRGLPNPHSVSAPDVSITSKPAVPAVSGTAGSLISTEIIDAAELAKRWGLPESWVRSKTRTRAIDRIPCLRFGRYVRFAWGSPELAKWLADHAEGA